MPAISSIAIAMVAVGTVTQAVGTMSEANAKADALNRNAQLADRNAIVAKQQAAHDVARQDKIGRMQIGAIRAGYGASGTTASEDILSMSITNAELDKLEIQCQGDLRARGYEDEATLDRFGARTAKSQGALRTASVLLSGAAKGATISALSGGSSPSPDGGGGGLRHGGEFGTTRNSAGALMEWQ